MSLQTTFLYISAPSSPRALSTLIMLNYGSDTAMNLFNLGVSK